jgi:large subunit ribosomal protein L3
MSRAQTRGIKRRSQLQRLRREKRSNNMSLSSLGLLGRKVGMMRLFTDDGDAVPVTVVDVSNNRVTQVKTQENDGYVSLQVTFGARKASRVLQAASRPYLAKAGVEAGEIIRNSASPRTRLPSTQPGATVPGRRQFRRRQKVGRAGHDHRQGLTPAPSSATT